MQLHPPTKRRLGYWPGKDYTNTRLANQNPTEPTIYRRQDDRFPLQVGDVVEIVNFVTAQVDYVYVAKEFDGEWWKLEWPD